MLEHLNAVNDVAIRPVSDPSFLNYGRVITGYDTEKVCSYMEEHTEIPDQGNIYIPSCEQMEQTELKEQIEKVLYGGMPVQIGYCNGVNSTYNGFEFHKGSEINIAVTDFMLVLSHVWLISQNTIRTSDAEVFFVQKGTMLEMYQTTLHLSPCRVYEEGFKDIVILPKGTNTPLSEEEIRARAESRDPQSVLLLQKNKWVLAHPEREPLIRQGAHPGLIGENKELKF